MKRRAGLLTCILVLLATAASTAGTELLPASPGCSQIVRHTAYTLCYDEEHEQAAWAMYALTREMLGLPGKRSDDFRPDPLVKTGSARPADYRRSGYDRGHLVPANDMKISRRSMSETFYMSNMSPQKPEFNRGIWKSLEEMVREWARENGEIHVVTGPVLADGGFSTIGRNRVSVPARFYKVILDYREPELKAIAFIIPNAGSEQPLQAFAMTVDQAEEETAIDFFPDLPDDVEEALESKLELDRWFGCGALSAKSESEKAAPPDK
ncbi:MAG TPA: DNA/RNA non-specific endonuclease [Deltaproteobacteria bacterium]|jgi:endonuclease G|nr:DNA/RNA non-specific endonuclease [Deltaproteobacteria bacterium]HOI06858.1 DNA/RNA non-specific endonuclease [Deltaproteobacteria bacterium]